MKAIMLGATALTFFAGAAGVSWFVWSEPLGDQSATAAKVETTDGNQQLSSDTSNDQTVGIHNRPASAEQLFRMGVLLREQQQGLINQREELQEEERRLKLVHQDIDNYQRQLDGMYAELRDKVATGQRLLEQLRDERLMLEEAQKEAEEAKQQMQVSALDPSKLANVKQMSRWFQGMDADAAAGIIREMANDGQIDFAVQLLSNVDDRKASGILSAIDDTQLVNDLLKKMREMIRTANKPSR